MQGFIDKEYYVHCATLEEVQQFYEMCKKYGLHFSTRWPVENELKCRTRHKATFVYDWDAEPENDGVSYWSFSTNGDGERPCKAFRQIIPLEFQVNINTSDFLSIL